MLPINSIFRCWKLPVLHKRRVLRICLPKEIFQIWLLRCCFPAVRQRSTSYIVNKIRWSWVANYLLPNYKAASGNYIYLLKRYKLLYFKFPVVLTILLQITNIEKNLPEYPSKLVLTFSTVGNIYQKYILC